MREARKGRAKPTIKNCNFIQHKHLNHLLLKDGAHRTHTHAHTKNWTKWSVMGPPVRRTVGLKIRVAGLLVASARLDY